MSAPAYRSSIRGGDVSHLTYGPIMTQLHTDDAINYLARHLAQKFNLAAGSIAASIQCSTLRCASSTCRCGFLESPASDSAISIDDIWPCQRPRRVAMR